MPDTARPLDSERLAKAFAFAAKLHDGQVRKGTDIPYISHLMAVASLVQEHGGSEDQVIAALLHDGPEDRGGRKTLRKIRRRFGKPVAKIVADCTDTFKKPKPPWLRRKQRYLAHLEEVSRDALLVSLADKVHNLRSIVRDYRDVGDAVWGRFRAGRRGTCWYYHRLARVYEARADEQTRGLVDEYLRSLAELDGLVAADSSPTQKTTHRTRPARST